ncbi:MAG: HEAT repeat domain-containing protein [Planctomycetota bacterium]|nr:HEAT repeat domain-containing protein [Planctomycetota bacterium]
MRQSIAILWLVAVCGGCAWAEGQIVNVDELPHKQIPLPNGTKVEVVVYQEHNWPVVDVSALFGTGDDDKDVCFESKFDSVVQPDKIKLMTFPVKPGPDDKRWATILADDKLKRRAERDFKRGDNVWFCGTLRRAAGNRLEFVAADVLKLPPDIERFEQNVERLRRLGDGEQLEDLGHRIEQQSKGEFNKGLDDFERMATLRDRAYMLGLTLQEKALKPGDADGRFALALKWRDRLKRNMKFRELVEEVLKLDPDHVNASHVAQDEWGYVKKGGKWRSRDEVAEMEKREREDLANMAAKEKAESESREQERKKVVQERQARLVASQAALRGKDARARTQAIASLGEAIVKSPDPGFGDGAVNILVNTDEAAVVPALVAAAKSQFPEVRKAVFEALAWRGGRQDGTAWDALATLLAAEKEAVVARVGIEAAADADKRAAAGALIAGLGNPSAAVQDEIIEGLKTVTKQQFSNKQEWVEWWGRSKADFNPN